MPPPTTPTRGKTGLFSETRTPPSQKHQNWGHLPRHLTTGILEFQAKQRYKMPSKLQPGFQRDNTTWKGETSHRRCRRTGSTHPPALPPPKEGRTPPSPCCGPLRACSGPALTHRSVRGPLSSRTPATADRVQSRCETPAAFYLTDSKEICKNAEQCHSSKSFL